MDIPDGIDLAPDIQTWPATTSDDFRAIVTALPAVSTIIEVGSWKGGSAITMARLRPLAHIHCVDTWLGSPDQHDNPDYAFPRDAYGYPRLYHQFLVNIKATLVHDRITAIPATARDGASILASRRIQADLIYIDGDHSHAGCHEDCINYWPLLRPGGILFGDDANVFQGVYSAAVRFAGERNLLPSLSFPGPFWILKKPV